MMNDNRGYIYLLVTRFSTKIGYSKNFTSRLNSLMTGLPLEPESIHCWNIPGAKKEEKRLHEKYKDKRVRGEWFDLSEDDVLSIATTYGASSTVDFGGVASRIVKVIKAEGWGEFTRSQLGRATRIKASELQKGIDILKSRGYLVKTKLKTDGRAADLYTVNPDALKNESPSDKVWDVLQRNGPEVIIDP